LGSRGYDLALQFALHPTDFAPACVRPDAITGRPYMDLRKLKKLIDLVEESGIADWTDRGEERVRI